MGSVVSPYSWIWNRHITTTRSKTSRVRGLLLNLQPRDRAMSNYSDDDPVVQYVVLRRDLMDTWPLGSVVTQGCHASVAAIWMFKDDPHTLVYCSPLNLNSMRKVSLEVKGEIQMMNLREKLEKGGIDHKLWMEQPENIPTCIATKPYPKSLISSFFKSLKLAK